VNTREKCIASLAMVGAPLGSPVRNGWDIVG
jgi:hypothetical protein